MKPSKLVTLLVVAAALLGLAVWSSHRRQSAPPSAIGKPVLRGLDIQAIGRVEISRTGSSITLKRTEDGWVVTNLFNYPVDLGKLQSNLLTLQGLKIGDTAPASALSTNVTLVDLQADSGRPLATLRLGDAYTRGGGNQGWRAPGGRYVSAAGDSHVYLVKETLDDFLGDAKTWIDTQLANVPSADIRSIEMASPTGQIVRLTREGGSLRLQGIATNEEFDASKSYGIEGALSYLTLADLANPRLGDAATGLVTPSTYRATLNNGDVYIARIGGTATNSTDRYVRLSVEFAAAGTNATLKAEQARRRAELEPKFRWTYLISGTSAENMTRSRADLVKPKIVSTNEIGAATTTNMTTTAP